MCGLLYTKLRWMWLMDTDVFNPTVREEKVDIFEIQKWHNFFIIFLTFLKPISLAYSWKH